MEKEEEPEFASTPNLEHEANGVSSKNEKRASDATYAAKNAKSGCQFLANGARQNQQYNALLQRALNPQPAGENSSPSAAPAAVTERLQPPQNLANLQHQLSPPQPQQFVLSSQPFWVQPQPSISVCATEGSWQAPARFGAGASPGCQPQAPNFCYPVGYPTYPGFPGSWDASLLWGQTQPLPFPGLSNYPRASNGFVYSQSWPMPVPSCVTSSCGQPLLRGVIKPPEKLSQKHQRLWEAQSAENVHFWSMIGQLQGELADCKGRLIKLEAEILSLRSAATDEPAVEVGNGGARVRGQPAKRGRSKQATAPVGSQPPLQTPTRKRKPAIGRTKAEEAKPSVVGRESLNKVDDKRKDFTSLDITEQYKNEGISAAVTQNIGIMEIDDGTLKMPSSLGNQVLQQLPDIQSFGLEFKSPSLLKSNHEGIISEDSERNNLSIPTSPTIYTNGHVNRQGITRWNFEDEYEAAESGFPAVGHEKEKEEMEDEFSSGPEEIETQNGSSWS